MSADLTELLNVRLEELINAVKDQGKHATSIEREKFYQEIYATIRSVTNATPADHASTHENGGADEISVAGLSGKLADAQDPTAHGSAAHTGTIGTWAQVDKTTSSIADIATRSHTALTDIGTNTHAQIDTHISSTAHTPSGTISLWGTAVAPSGYLLCDGTAVSRTTYADLFAVIGVTYGAGDTTTTFNVPNLKGKVPVGYSSTETEFDALGETGGEKTHVLTEAELAQHTHVQNAHSHTQRTRNTFVGGTTGVAGVNSANNADGGSTADSTATNQNAGSNTPHNNLQPYLTLNFIIKV